MLPMLTDSERDQYEELSIEMFRLNPPRGKVNPLMCPRCETPFEEWYILYILYTCVDDVLFTGAILVQVVMQTLLFV